MHQTCEICDNAGTLRDGSPCPRCSNARWKQLGLIEEVARPKRIVWVQSVRPEIPGDRVSVVRRPRAS